MLCEGRLLLKHAEASSVMSWQLPEIAKHSLVPKLDHPLWSEQSYLYNYFFFSSKLFANPLKSNSQT